MIRIEILDAARHLISEDRERDYGSPRENFGRIAAFWESYLNIPITMTDVAWMMVLLKIARSQNNGDNDDNFVDAAGYAALAAELSKEHE